MSQKVFADVQVVEARWLHEPLAPCTLLPAGAPGIFFLVWLDARGIRRSGSYGVWLYGEPGKVIGVRLVSPEFKVYDVDKEGPGGPVCDCRDFTARARKGGCKHIAALRWVGELPPLENLSSGLQQEVQHVG